MEVIDKAVVVAEIERIKEDAGIGLNAYEMGEENGKLEVCEKLLSFIDSVEVEEVDLDKEIGKYLDANDIESSNQIKLLDFAKHFIGLGLKAKKGG